MAQCDWVLNVINLKIFQLTWCSSGSSVVRLVLTDLSSLCYMCSMVVYKDRLIMWVQTHIMFVQHFHVFYPVLLWCAWALHECESVSDLAFRTDEAAHVLHHSDDRQLDLLTKPDLLSHILQRHLLNRQRDRERERNGNRKTERERQSKRGGWGRGHIWEEVGETGKETNSSEKSKRKKNISLNCFSLPRKCYQCSLEKPASLAPMFECLSMKKKKNYFRSSAQHFVT